MILLALLCFFCALVPGVLFAVNLRLYREPPAPVPDTQLPAVSILIPARNEAAGIASALHAALATEGIAFEVVVMDDSSTDATASIVQAIATQHPLGEKLRLEQAPPLPPGWNGKQHACWALAHAARNPILCFVDADVRLGPQCIARMAAFLQSSTASLVSGFPRQVTVTPFEWLLLPLIHFVLLGFLPISRMRNTTDPAFAAGCGQFLMARAPDYFACGGHSGIKLTMHDGLRLPRLFRAAGLRTDLADITPHASCRMYTSARDTWNGLAKNATEGLAAPTRILPITLLLLLGQVLPAAYLGYLAAVTLVLTAYEALVGVGVFGTLPHTFYLFITLMVAAFFLAYLPRIQAARRFHQPWRSVILHPLGILLLLAIQWTALTRHLLHRPTAWRNRTYP